jgi:radical SAM superfamily enzyme YgiQ (UPF0313 family)
MNTKLLKKAQELLDRETGTVFKDPGGKINIALVYPNTYSLGMASLGYQGIYGLLNGFPDVVCERVFLPADADIDEYERTGTEPFSLESKRTLSRFDIVAFSVSFENDYPNIVKMLRMARIPERRDTRSVSHPVLILGGVCAFFNPEPLADFFDVCFTGEGEEMLPEFLDVYRSSRSRDEIIKRACGITGVYVPRYYSVSFDSATGMIAGREAAEPAPDIIVKRTVSDISSPSFRTVITTPDAEFADMCLIEAMRGCPWSCRYCVAGHIYKPVRRKELPALKDDINDALKRTGRVGLIGPSLSDYPYAEEVLSMEGVDFSVTSLRASPKSARIVALLRGHKSASIAPEAGTQRLRDVINKRITDPDIEETARLILESGIETLRLYFMIGLPTETAEDVDGIVGLVKKVRRTTRKGFLTLSVSTFVPKPFTPFQWHPMKPLKDVKEALKTIKKGLAMERGVKVFHDVPKYAYLQGVFSMGDRRVSALAIDLASGGTFKVGGPMGNQGYYIFRRKEFNEILPWDFIDAGVSKERLWKEYDAALS